MKNYQLRFQGKIGEISAYEGSILAVGISYDRKTKKHSCEVEKAINKKRIHNQFESNIKSVVYPFIMALF